MVDRGPNTAGTLEFISALYDWPEISPVLEETYYWVGMARAAQGDMEKAIFDLKKAVDLNPNSTPASQELRRMGIEYP